MSYLYAFNIVTSLLHFQLKDVETTKKMKNSFFIFVYVKFYKLWIILSVNLL